MPGPTPEQIKKYVKLLKPIFEERGMVMTDAKINKMVAESVTPDVKRAQRIEKMDKLQSEARTKYPSLQPKDSKSYGVFERIYHTMLRPELTEKDVKHNKHLQELSKTPEGQRRIIKDAADMVMTLDGDMIYGDPSDVMAEYEKNYTAMQLGFIAASISKSLEAIDKDTSLSEKERKEILPKNFRKDFDDLRPEYEESGRIQPIVSAMSNPLYGLIPKDIPHMQIINKVMDHKFDTDEISLTSDEMVYLNQFLGTSLAAEENRKSLEEASKKYFAPRFEAAKQKMGMFKEKHPEYKVLDQDGREVPSTRDIHFGDRYNFLKENGDVFGARVNGKVKFERMYEIFPKVAAIGKAIKEKKFPTLGILDKHLESLKKAKTTFNSKEYNDLIKMVDYVNKNDKFKPELDLAKDQEYALKLIALKNQINKYLVHKAKDGVNKKVYGKLAAVEALNKDISDRLGKLSLAPFKYSGKRFDVKKLPLTYEQEQENYVKKLPLTYEQEQENYVKKYDGKLSKGPTGVSDVHLSNHINYNLMEKFPDTNFDATVIRNVDDCMNRIIMNASTCDLTPQEYNDLYNIKNKFYNNPSSEAIVKEPQLQAENNVRSL